MPQVPKPAVREAITAAAAQGFAEDGFAAASVADIARRAGVSTGNVYRYFPSKEALFEAVVDDAFVAAFVAGLRRRIGSLRGVADVDGLPADAPFHVFSEELVRFAIENRLRVVVLLGRSAGTRHAAFADELVSELRALAVAHFQAQRPDLAVTDVLRHTLGRVYRNVIATTIDVLGRFTDEAEIREALTLASRYHLAGLRSFFEGAPVEQGRQSP